MGLGMPPFLAQRMATEPVIASAAGGTRASATAIGGSQYLTSFVLGTGSGGCVLPSVGGDNGALLGDDFVINNIIAGGLYVYAPTGCSISINGSYSSGSGGFNLSSHTTATFFPVTSTTWVGVMGG